MTELLRGGELLERIRKSEHLTEHRAALVWKKLLGGVQHIHAKGIVHRDLKPEVLYSLVHKICSLIKPAI